MAPADARHLRQLALTPRDNCSSVGFTGDLDALVEYARATEVALSAAEPGLRVRLLHDPSGAVLAVTERIDGAVVCVTPAYAAQTVVTVYPTGLTADATCPWCRRLTCELRDEQGNVITSFTVAVADLAYCRNAIRVNRPLRLRISAYPYTITEHTGPPDSPPAGSGRITGVVTGARWATNGRTGSRFAVLTIKTQDLSLELTADPVLVPELPRPGTIVDATVGLIGLYAGPITDLIARPAMPQLLDPARDGRVMAALVTSATVTPAGIVACCVDEQMRWQLRLFRADADEPDRVTYLNGWPEQCHVVADGVAVLCGSSLLTFDHKLRRRFEFDLPPEAEAHVLHGRFVAWVVLQWPCGPGREAPDAAGTAALRRGDTVHRFEVWRIGLSGHPVERFTLERSAIYRRDFPPGAPAWEGVSLSAADGSGMWVPIPGETADGRPAQHLVELGQTGPPSVTTVTGPDWEVSRLRIRGHLLTGDTGGLRADGRRLVADTSAVRARWFAVGDWVLGEVKPIDGRSTNVVELSWREPVLPRPIDSPPGHVTLTAAVDPDNGRRWLLLGSRTAARLAVVGSGGSLRAVADFPGFPSLIAVSGDNAVLVDRLPESPVVNLHTGEVGPSGLASSGDTCLILSSLIRVRVDPG